MQIKREAKIYPRKLPSGNTSYRVDLGMIHGKRVTKDFKTEIEAQRFASKANTDLHTRNLGALQDLAATARYDILAALERLKPFNVTVRDAVDFYLRYAKPAKGTITVDDAVKLFAKEKLRANRKPRYVNALLANYLKPLVRKFPKKLVNEITMDEMKSFIYVKGRAPKTIANYLKSLGVFFNFFIKAGYSTLNPLANLERPELDEGKPAFLTVDQASSLLEYALENNRKGECACMALILFCGVRVEEAKKLSWEDVRLETRKVHLDAIITKKRKKRINQIAENALVWLTLCKGDGIIVPKNYMNRLRHVRKKIGLKYFQNSMRHSFASYHVAMHEDAAKTAFMLGHPDANLLYNTYRELIGHEDAKRYWDIIPASIRTQREEEKDKAERIEAESQSNCGKAIRDENGKWIPCMNVNDEGQGNPFESPF